MIFELEIKYASKCSCLHFFKIKQCDRFKYYIFNEWHFNYNLRSSQFSLFKLNHKCKGKYLSNTVQNLIITK